VAEQIILKYLENN